TFSTSTRPIRGRPSSPISAIQHPCRSHATTASCCRKRCSTSPTLTPPCATFGGPKPRVERCSSRHPRSASSTPPVDRRATGVASDHRDPFQLCVHPTNFAAQLEVLREVADVVPLTELWRRRAKRRRRPLVALTFDDGYADNLLNAAPLLERGGLPATVYVSS